MRARRTKLLLTSFFGSGEDGTPVGAERKGRRGGYEVKLAMLFPPAAVL